MISTWKLSKPNRTTFKEKINIFGAFFSFCIIPVIPELFLRLFNSRFIGWVPKEHYYIYGRQNGKKFNERFVLREYGI